MNESANAARLQIAELLADALENAAKNKGVWLNVMQKSAPIVEGHPNISPFNELSLMLHSDWINTDSNYWTTTPSGSVHPAPILLYHEPEYRKKADGSVVKDGTANNPSLTPVFRDEALQLYIARNPLPPSPPHSAVQDFDRLFDQYAKQIVIKPSDGADYIEKSGTIEMPPREDYDSPIEAIHDLVSAAALALSDKMNHPGVNIQTSTKEEQDNLQLVQEITTGIVMAKQGRSALLAPSSIETVPKWITALRDPQKGPQYIKELEHKIDCIGENLQRMERGEKIKPSLCPEIKQRLFHEDQDAKNGLNYEFVTMTKAKDAPTTLLFKFPEDEKATLVPLPPQDIARYYKAADPSVEPSAKRVILGDIAATLRDKVQRDPTIAIDPKYKDVKPQDTARISEPAIVRLPETGKFLLSAKIDGKDQLHSRIITPSQYFNMMATSDHQDYMKNLAAHTFAVLLHPIQLYERDNNLVLKKDETETEKPLATIDKIRLRSITDPRLHQSYLMSLAVLPEYFGSELGMETEQEQTSQIRGTR